MLSEQNGTRGPQQKADAKHLQVTLNNTLVN